ncbi:MAG: hypothetical protein B6A08_17825 [Sorangiineae bacterium NIC37A_2]|nr:MAG: hypothetical protein B6A08_17825 [Sorangiineae bacterium NIC37A_2]
MRRLQPLLWASLIVPSFWGACAPGLASGDGAGAPSDDGAGGRKASSGGGQGSTGGARASGGEAGAAPGASGGVTGGGTGGRSGEPTCEGGCPRNASCVVEYDDAFCECDEGYEKDEGKCVDIDECALDEPCGDNALCVNKRGGYECSCEEGYVGDGESCVPRLRLASVSPSGDPANSFSGSPALSADGLVLAFFSRATNLVPNDTNDVDDIFVFERETGRVTRVSVSSAGEEANDWSDAPALCGDGRYVVFSSIANNLVLDDTNGELDVFRHDRETGETIRVSIAHDGSELLGGEGYSASPSISNDGNRVVFTSMAPNLVPDDTNEYPDQFVRDILADTIVRANLHSDGTQVGKLLRTPNSTPQISGNGRYVSFVSLWSGLGGDVDDYADIYRRDLRDGFTHQVSYPPPGFNNDGHAAAASISGDGRFVVFDSASTTQVEGDTNGATDVFLRDMNTGVLERVSVGSDGEEANGSSYIGAKRAVSNDGRYVIFVSLASNLVEGDTNGLVDVFVRDRVLKKTIRVNVGPKGEEADHPSSSPTISADGKIVAFESSSETFGVETDGRPQIWVRDLSP